MGFFFCMLMFQCRYESLSTLWGLSSVVCFWTLEASIGQHPVMSIFHVDIDPIALFRLKVTAPWRTAGSVPQRNIIHFHCSIAVRTVDSLQHHLVKDISCVSDSQTKQEKHYSCFDLELKTPVWHFCHLKFSRRGYGDFCNLPAWRHYSRLLPKNIRQLPTPQHMHGEAVSWRCG